MKTPTPKLTLAGVAPAAPLSAPGPGTRSAPQETSPGSYSLYGDALRSLGVEAPMASDDELRAKVLGLSRQDLELRLIEQISRASVRLRQYTEDGNVKAALEEKSQLASLERSLDRLQRSGIK